MTTAEIIVLILIICIVMFVGITYFLHGRKIEKKNKAEKKSKEKSDKTEEKKFEDKGATSPEEKPVPVGIIREEKPEYLQANSKDLNNSDGEYDLAPLKEKPAEPQKNPAQNLKTDIKNLSPEMKKVIMSDILKPKF